MKINEVEERVGITKRNIRFYEKEGLLTPQRNSDNGYRDYGEEEVEVLLENQAPAQAGRSSGGDPPPSARSSDAGRRAPPPCDPAAAGGA